MTFITALRDERDLNSKYARIRANVRREVGINVPNKIRFTILLLNDICRFLGTVGFVSISLYRVRTSARYYCEIFLNYFGRDTRNSRQGESFPAISRTGVYRNLPDYHIFAITRGSQFKSAPWQTICPNEWRRGGTCHSFLSFISRGYNFCTS